MTCDSCSGPMHRHPEASAEVIRIMREEASALMPGQSLFTYDWD